MGRLPLFFMPSTKEFLKCLVYFHILCFQTSPLHGSFIVNFFRYLNIWLTFWMPVFITRDTLFPCYPTPYLVTKLFSMMRHCWDIVTDYSMRREGKSQLLSKHVMIDKTNTERTLNWNKPKKSKLEWGRRKTRCDCYSFLLLCKFQWSKCSKDIIGGVFFCCCFPTRNDW